MTRYLATCLTQDRYWYGHRELTTLVNMVHMNTDVLDPVIDDALVQRGIQPSRAMREMMWDGAEDWLYDLHHIVAEDLRLRMTENGGSVIIGDFEFRIVEDGRS